MSTLVMNPQLPSSSLLSPSESNAFSTFLDQFVHSDDQPSLAAAPFLPHLSSRAQQDDWKQRYGHLPLPHSNGFEEGTGRGSNGRADMQFVTDNGQGHGWDQDSDRRSSISGRHMPAPSKEAIMQQQAAELNAWLSMKGINPPSQRTTNDRTGDPSARSFHLAENEARPAKRRKSGPANVDSQPGTQSALGLELGSPVEPSGPGSGVSSAHLQGDTSMGAVMDLQQRSRSAYPVPNNGLDSSSSNRSGSFDTLRRGLFGDTDVVQTNGGTSFVPDVADLNPTDRLHSMRPSEPSRKSTSPDSGVAAPAASTSTSKSFSSGPSVLSQPKAGPSNVHKKPSGSTSPSPPIAKSASTSSQREAKGKVAGQGKPALLSEAQKKANHIASEQKRRAAIRLGYDTLCSVVPALREAVKEFEERLNRGSTTRRDDEDSDAEDGQKASKGKGKRGRRRADGEGGGALMGGIEIGGEKIDGRAGPKSEAIVLAKSVEHLRQLLGDREGLLGRLSELHHLARSKGMHIEAGSRLWDQPWDSGPHPPSNFGDGDEGGVGEAMDDSQEDEDEVD